MRKDGLVRPFPNVEKLDTVPTSFQSMSWSQQHSPDLGSDSLLAESAQLRSTLQAKTYLQALSPDERRRLLKGTKISGRLLAM